MVHFFLWFLPTIFFFTTSKAAIAKFSLANTGISGNVTINDREVIVDLDLSKLNYSKLPYPNCFEKGAKYHIHEKWTYNDSDDRIGAAACAATYTGGHWDPYLACSTTTGNDYCETDTTSTIGCVPSSTAYDDDNVYACNTTTYKENAYVCEVGDFNGKYGKLYVNNETKFARRDKSFWEVKSSDVYKKAIVFHCGNSTARAFCAPFDDSNDTTTHELVQTTGNVIARFESIDLLSKIELNEDGTYRVEFDLRKLQDAIPCDTMIYRIYDQWNASNEDNSFFGQEECSDEVVGQVWDPTQSCLYGSASPYCTHYSESYKLCNVSSYEYECNANVNRYSCSPSDLSGKYGIISITDPGFFFFLFQGQDDLLPPTNLLLDKSIVLECADHSERIACARIHANFINPNDKNHEKYHHHKKMEGN